MTLLQPITINDLAHKMHPDLDKENFCLKGLVCEIMRGLLAKYTTWFFLDTTYMYIWQPFFFSIQVPERWLASVNLREKAEADFAHYKY